MFYSRLPVPVLQSAGVHGLVFILMIGFWMTRMTMGYDQNIQIELYELVGPNHGVQEIQRKAPEASERKSLMKKEEKFRSATADDPSIGPDSSTSESPEASHSEYYQTVMSVLNKAKIYPRLAKLRSETGTVRVSFFVTEQGEIQNVQITQPCSFESLNLAAVELLRRAERLPKPAQAMHLELPIQYSLN